MTQADELAGEYAVTAHSDAAARLLLIAVKKLRRGLPPEEVGEEVELLGRMMRRAI